MFVPPPIHKHLASLRLTLLGRDRRRARRPPPTAPGARFRLEGLEDRCLLSITDSRSPHAGAASGSRRAPTATSGSPSTAQPDRDDQPDDPRHHRVPRPHRQRRTRSGSRRAPTATSGSPSDTPARSAMINPTTHAITEFPIPTAGSGPTGSRRAPTATSGSPSRERRQDRDDQPDHPRHHRVPLPTAQFRPYGITAGPDGNLWFTEAQRRRSG